MPDNKKKNIIFLGSKSIGYNILKYLTENCDRLNASVIGVLSNDRTIDPNSPSITSICHQNNIPIIPYLDELCKLENIDFLISVQYHEILKERHLKTAREAAINLHMAPLPEYRGCNQFSFAIIDQKEVFGTTLHLMSPGIDNGDILFEKRFQISSEITVTDLYEKTEIASFNLFAENIEMILTGNYTPVPQEQLIEERGSSFHTRKEINKIKKIDLSWPEDKIDRYIRATYFPPFPPPYALKGNSKIELSPNWKEEIK